MGNRSHFWISHSYPEVLMKKNRYHHLYCRDRARRGARKRILVRKGNFAFLQFSVRLWRRQRIGQCRHAKRDVTDFKAVQVGGAFDVEIVAQKEFAVEVEGDDNLLELIKTDVSGETLEIRSEKRFSTNGRLKIRISAPDIDKVDLSGASTVNLVGLNNDSLRIESSGASKIKVNGVTKDLVVDMSGASKLDAADLKSVNANVDASGACHIIVAVSGDLKADLSGASKVTYSGNPKNVERKVSGASSVTGN